MTACSAYGCTNRPSKKSPGITFHAFPRDEVRRSEWIKAVRRKDWMPSTYSKLCSAHFSEDQIDRTSLSCVRLREKAVPNIFSAFPSYFQKCSSLTKCFELLPSLDSIAWRSNDAEKQLTNRIFPVNRMAPGFRTPSIGNQNQQLLNFTQIIRLLCLTNNSDQTIINAVNCVSDYQICIRTNLLKSLLPFASNYADLLNCVGKYIGNLYFYKNGLQCDQVDSLLNIIIDIINGNFKLNSLVTLADNISKSVQNFTCLNSLQG